MKQNSWLFYFLCWLGRNNLLPRFIWSIGGDNTGWASFFVDLPFCQDIVVGGDMWNDIAVLDNRFGTVHLYKGVPIFYGDEFNHFLEYHGHNPSNCDYMVFNKVYNQKVDPTYLALMDEWKKNDVRETLR